MRPFFIERCRKSAAFDLFLFRGASSFLGPLPLLRLIIAQGQDPG